MQKRSQLIAVVFLLIAFLQGFDSKAQVSLAINISASDSVVLTGNPFFYNISFAVTSSNLPGKNVVITDTLPPYVKFLNLANSSLISGAVYDSVTRVVSITLIDPLPAGTTGNLQMNAKFAELITPNSFLTYNKVYIQASNAIINPVISNSVLVSSSSKPAYVIYKDVASYDAINKIVTWNVYLDYDPFYKCKGVVGVLGIKGLSIEDSIPINGEFISASSGGVESFPGSRKIVWDLGDVGVDNCSYSGKQYLQTISIKYPASPYNSSVSNHAVLKGILSGNVSFKIDTSAYFTLLSPSNGVACVDQYNNSLFPDFGYVGSGGVLTSPITNSGNVPLKDLSISIQVPDQIKVDSSLWSVYTDSALNPKLYYVTNSDSITRIPILDQVVVNGFVSWKTPQLPSGIYIKQYIFVYDSFPPGQVTVPGLKFNVLNVDMKGNKVVPTLPFHFQTPCDGIGTCIHFQTTIEYTYGNQQYISSCSVDKMARQPIPLIGFGRKSVLNTNSFVPGDTVDFLLEFYNEGAAFIHPVLLDTLASQFEYIPNSAYFFDTSNPPPTVLQNGQALKFSFENDSVNNYTGQIVGVGYKVKIRDQVPAGIYYNSYLGGADNYPFGYVNQFGGTWSGSTAVVVNATYSMEGDKGVKGDIDNDYLFYPNNATTINGSEVSYRLRVKNTGNATLNDVVMVDALPYTGDSRGSQFSPFMTDLPTSNQKGVIAYYSLDSNICINEISPPIIPAGCVTPTWTTIPPADLKKIKALKFLLPDSLKGGDSLNVTWNMSTPSGLKVNQVAYNDFHYQARKASDGNLLLTSSPNKVGVVISALAQIGQYVWLDKNQNGLPDEDSTAGLDGIKVQLWKPGTDGIANTPDDSLVATTVTSDTIFARPGYYRFTAKPGQYFVKFVVDTCHYHATTAIGFTSNLFALSAAQLNFDLNLGLDSNRVAITSTATCIGANTSIKSVLVASFHSPVYKWQKSTDGGTSWVNIAGETNADLHIGSVTFSDTGLYRLVVWNATDSTCKVVSKPSALQLSNPVTPSYLAPSICAGKTVVLNKTSPSASGTYYWYRTDTGGMPLPNPFTTPALATNVTYYLADSISGGCSSTRVPVLITVNPVPPNPNYTVPSSCLGATVVLDKTSPASVGTYYWYTELLGGTASANPFITPSLTTTATFYLIDSISTTSCKSARIAVTIVVDDCAKTIPDSTHEVFFPNGFSPNNDGINDVYTVFNVPAGVKVSILFFDRWGDLVYKNDDYQNDWAGKCEGSLCLGQQLPSSTYFMKATLSSGKKYTVNVTLIR